MKPNYLQKLFGVAAIVLSVVWGCKPDPTVPPPSRIFDLQFSGDSATVFPALGEVVETALDAQVPFEKTVSVRVYRQVDSTAEEMYDDTYEPQTSNFQYTFSYKTGAPQPKGNGKATNIETAGSDVWFRFVAQDENGQKAEQRFHVAVRGGKLKDLGEIVLYMLNDNNNADTLNMFSTTTAERISPAAALKDVPGLGARIDFGYIYTPIDEIASLASVSTYPTNFLLDPLMPGNITRFRKTSMSIQDFVKLKEADESVLLDAYIQGVAPQNTAFQPPESMYKGLKAGDVLGFATDESKIGGRKIGLIRVADILPGLGGKITLEIKVQD